MNKVFELYGLAGASDLPNLIKAGRLPHQAEAARLIAGDVETKLALAPHHSLLEIGCGTGELLIPLSFCAARSVGIDHAKLVAAARARFTDTQVEFCAGAFPDVALDGTFDRILVYSVIHYLADYAAVQDFVMAAAALLAPQGRLLVGDIPSIGRKARFLNSEAGKAFDADWKERTSAQPPHDPGPTASAAPGDCIGALDDEQIAGLLRQQRQAGYHAYILPQHGALPFGNTREDLLVINT